MTERPITGTVIFAMALAACALAAWGWQARVRERGGEAMGEAWERVRKEYPVSEEIPEPPHLAPEVVTRVLAANPFSEARRPVAAPATNIETAPQTLAPQFLYKGRINLGQRQRAIMEETVSHKTYFLEVGQEVAGFKVLDIAENRVVLSDTKSQKELVVSLSSTAAGPAKAGGPTQ